MTLKSGSWSLLEWEGVGWLLKFFINLVDGEQGLSDEILLIPGLGRTSCDEHKCSSLDGTLPNCGSDLSLGVGSGKFAEEQMIAGVFGTDAGG